MCRLHPPYLLEPPPTQLTGLDRCVAVLGEIYSWRQIVVESNGHFGKARAQRTVSVEPVGKRKGRSVVGRLLARCRSEAKEGDYGKRHL